MRQALSLHPESPCQAVSAIEVEIARPGPLVLTYRVMGAMAKLIMPAMAAAARTDGLWRRTCFEAFVGVGDGYLELNFSPSTEWAAYRFTSYRAGMAPALDLAAPAIAVSADMETLELRVSVDLPADAEGPLGLSAVIEEPGGRLSYWALGHRPGKPDFHHWRAFAIDLPSAGRP
jgi:hypothetical protein